MLNHIVIMGRFTKDPELRRTATGTAVTSFTLACDRDFKDKETGEKGVDFIDCVAWKTSAEFVSKHFSKGRMAAVEGRLQMREWTDKEGNKRRSAEVLASSVYFADSKHEVDFKATAEARNSGATPSLPNDSQFAELSGEDGELPF